METSDSALVRQAVLLNDTGAFEVLVRRHQSRVLTLQRSLVRDRALAEDLCQETFLRAWQKLGRFSGTGSFGGWLAKVGYNVFLQYLRRSRKQRFEEPLSDEELAHSVVDNAAASVELAQLLAFVSTEERLLLMLNYGYGLSNPEIAELLEQPVGTIKSQIFRAKHKIQARLATEGRLAEIRSSERCTNGVRST